MKRFSIIKNFKYFLSISSLLVAGSIYVFVSNLRWSIEFTGGIKMIIAGYVNINTKKFKQDFSSIKPDIIVMKKGKNTLIVFRSLDPKIRYNNKILSKLKEYLKENGYIKGPQDIISTSFVGPTIGTYMKNTAKIALIWGIVLMAVYILIAFIGVRIYFAPWIFSVVTILTLMHDVIMAAGGYGIWMILNKSVVVNSIFVMAILTVLGYSVNDTIIIFDRIRENIIKYHDKIKQGNKKLYEIFDESVYQVMRRSLLTSISTLLVVICMYIFGNDLFKDFSFVIFVGVFFGTYSSIFLAAPGAYRINKFLTKQE